MMLRTKIMATCAVVALAVTGIVFGSRPMHRVVAQANVPVKDTFEHSLVLKDRYAFNAKKKGFIKSQTTQELIMKWVDNDYTKFYIMSDGLYLHNSSADLSFSSSPTFWTAFHPYQLSPIGDSSRALIYRGGDSDIIKNYAVSNIGGEYSVPSLNIDYEVWTTRDCAAQEGIFADNCIKFLSQSSHAPASSSEESTTSSAAESTTSSVSESAAPVSKTVTFNQQELKANPIVTKQGISIDNTSDYGTNTVTELRVYKNATLTISGPIMTSIVFTCTANGTTKQGPGCFGSGAPDGYTFESDGKTGTWTGNADTVSFTASSNQVRITQIVITLA